MKTQEEQREEALCALSLLQTHLALLAQEYQQLPQEDRWPIPGEIEQLKKELLLIEQRLILLATASSSLPAFLPYHSL
jgi:hypothetical protein